MKTCTPQELKKILEEKPEGVKFWDVRTPAEYAQEHIDGFENVFLTPDITAKVGRDTTIYIHCMAGGRSSFACSQLEKIGYANVVNIVGGLNAWKEAGYPTVTP